MLRPMLSSRSMAILAASFLAAQTVACTPSASSSGSGGGSGNGSGGNGSGGSGSGSGGSASGGKVGSGGSASGGSSSGGSSSGGKVGSGGSASGGSSSGGSGSGSGGSSSGGSGSGSGGSASGGSGTGSGGSGTGSGGSGTGSGGSGTGSGGSGSGSGGMMGMGNPDCPVGGNIISDFEEGTTATTINPKGGVWTTYKGMGTITPAPLTASTTPTGVATATDGSGTCKGALHVVASGATDYSGVGATFAPAPTSSMLKLANAVDVSSHKGISFKIKSGSGTPPAVYFDIKTKDTVPKSEGGSLGEDGAMSSDEGIGLRNNRGWMLNTPWIGTGIGTSWQTVTVPFAMLIPRWVPAPGTSGSGVCKAPGSGVPKCQAPKFDPKNVLGIEISPLPDDGFPKPSGSTVGTYDLWIDDVAWVDDDSGLPTISGFPLMGAGSVGMCTKPTGADAKYLVPAYNQWKATFVSGGKVIRPENGNDTVSEGIAYGMLLAVNFNDKTLFDQLYTYWKGNKAAGGTPGLMTWCIPAGSNSCSASGGSATDADEDAAFALLQAGKVFGTASYTSDAKALIADIWANDIDAASNLPTGGSNYKSTSSKVTNPSYFAPAYYRIFASNDSHGWAAVADKSISAIAGVANGSTGLVPAWCQGDCKSAGSNGAATDNIYQYDSHRVPMRVALDYCWNGTASAKSYADKITSFFATDAHAGKDGISRINDLYNLDGTLPSGGAPNSTSAVGTAAVGAMATSNKQFLDDAYQAVFDTVTRGTLAPVKDGKTGYSYYNATVGLLTLLIMTGNFSH